MKKTILCFLLFSKVLFAQDSNDRKIYLDSLGNENPGAEPKFYRIIKDYELTKDEYRFEDYYFSGKLRAEGNSIKKEYLREKGEFITYYENGNRKSVIHFDNGLENGDCAFWYENGSKKLEGEYLLSGNEKEKTVLFKINNYWNANNIQKTINGNGEFDDDGTYERHNQYSLSNGKLKNGFKDGEWKGTHSKPDFTFTELYKNKKFVSGVSIDAEGTKYEYSEILSKAQPINGLEDFYKHVMKNFNTPETFQGAGKVITEFIIDKQGGVVDLKTIKSVREDVDNEAKRCISAYKGFVPLKLRGIKVRCTYRIPIAIESAE